MKLRLRQLLISLILLPLILVSVVFTSPQKTSAVSGANWKAGRIIDDSIFFNKSSMSVAQIQAFLNAKVPVCAKNHSAYSASYPPPYTCLKDYQENTTTGESNIGRYNSDGTPYQVPGGKSSAQIIWDAAQAYNINPQTLIVMLQKEQSLVTDDWPLIVQYQKAMGQSCPDTAPCDPAFAGFYRQVSGGARQFRHYVDHPEAWNFRSGVTRFVRYSPNVDCGGANVFIETAATAALYNYTPYQPNAGALNNLYGTASCGAYGNRNFWRLFNDWFGSTYIDDYRDNDADGLANAYDLCTEEVGLSMDMGCPSISPALSSTLSGDFNGDSYGDVIALSLFGDGRTFNVWMYPGSISGVADPVFQFTLGPQFGGWDYRKIKTIATNVNGDAYMDLVIFHQGPGNEIAEHVLLGSSSGLRQSDPSMVRWQFPSSGWLWSNVRLVGGANYNGDAYDDVMVLSKSPYTMDFDVWLFPGSASGLQSPIKQLSLSQLSGGWDYRKTKTIATNVNGDAYMDLVIFHQGPGNEIVEHVLLGSANGQQASDPNMVKWQLPSSGWMWSNLRLVGSADFNGDNYGDVIALSLFGDARTFNVWMYPGSALGITNPVFQFTLGPQLGGWDYRKTKTVAANVNGDAYMDLVIFHQGPGNEIVKHVLLGSASGLRQSEPSMVRWQFPSSGWLWSNIRQISTQ